MIEGDKLSILELMYAMMLPSGNDAAVALGVHLGGIIKHAGTKDPEVVITPEAVERRLRALKLVAARNFREEKERSQQEQFDLNSENQDENLSERPAHGDSMTYKQLIGNYSRGGRLHKFKKQASYEEEVDDETADDKKFINEF